MLTATTEPTGLPRRPNGFHCHLSAADCAALSKSGRTLRSTHAETTRPPSLIPSSRTATPPGYGRLTVFRSTETRRVTTGGAPVQPTRQNPAFARGRHASVAPEGPDRSSFSARSGGAHANSIVMTGRIRGQPCIAAPQGCKASRMKIWTPEIPDSPNRPRRDRLRLRRTPNPQRAAIAQTNSEVLNGQRAERTAKP
jgi:hypothetical protein